MKQGGHLHAIGDPAAGAGAASKERLRLWLKLLKASRFMENVLRERLRDEFATTLPRFDVMAALYRAESGLRMSELSSVLRVSNGNVTGIVDRLVADRMIMRVPVDNDRRAMVVRLTARGREAFMAMASAHENWVNELLSDISRDESIETGMLLDRVTDSNTAIAGSSREGKED